MEEKKESLEDYQLYQLSKVIDYDYSKIAEIITNTEDKSQFQTIKKDYVHSLFTPVLSYIIGYLNNNKEEKGTIGKSKIDGIEVIYIVLNHKIYDLFFTREKGIVFNEENEIDFNTEKENYYLPPIQVETEINEEILNQLANSFYGEMNNVSDTKELFKFKKKEILSKFKLGYSIQERIINALISKANNQIIELPNLIFYKNNVKKKIFSETDRVITVNKLTEVNKFLIYFKAEFRTSKQMEYIEIEEGIKLNLEKNSCSFIEIKTSMYHLLDKENEEKNDNNDYISVTSSINSGNTDKKSIFTKMYYNMEAFINLFANLFEKFKKINLIIIIDSYFPKDFFSIAKTFANSLDNNIKIKFDFDLYFIHVESDMIYANDLIKNKEKDKEIKDLLQDSNDKEKKINQISADMNALKIDSEQKYNKLKKESENRIKELEDKMKSFELTLYELNMEKKVLNIKKHIQKDNDLLEKIKNETKNMIECKIKKKIEIIGEKKIFDYKTFCRLYYTEENLDLIDTIKKKHFKNLDKYININKNIKIEKLVLIVDFVFIISLKDIMKKYFQNKSALINGFSDDFFKITFSEPKENNVSFAMTLDYPGFQIVNLNDVPDMNNFISYYFEIKKIKNGNKGNIKFFPLYNPILNRNDCYLEIQETNAKNNKIEAAFLIIDPNYEPEDISIKFYEENFKYIVFLYKIYLFEKPDKDTEKKYFDKLFKLIFPKKVLNYETFYIENTILGIEDVGETISQKLSKLDKTLLIINKNKNTIESKFKFNIKNANYTINTDIIIDENIKCIMDSISLRKNMKINVLIDQSCNVLYQYLKNKYKKGQFVLLNNIPDDNINDLKQKITTYEKDEFKMDIISYITKNDKEKFDLIISEYSLSGNANLFNNKDALLCIRNHLNKNGRFVVRLFFDNIYEIKHIQDYLHSVFTKVEILNKSFVHKLDNVLSCSN